MLKHLYVKNFILIDEADLDFDAGFSVFTGETGAGKSILIDAISLLCGQRAQAGFVKKGENKALIEGVFDFSANPRVLALLQEAGFDGEEDVVISREIGAEGKSQMRLNHRVTTANFIRELLGHEIDIHSQHDTQYLLNRSSFLNLLDQYLDDEALLSSVKTQFKAYRQLKDQLEEARSPKAEQDLEFLRFQLNEIEQAQLKPGEEEKLEAIERRIAAREKIYQRVAESLEILDGEQSMVPQLYEAARLTGGFPEETELAEISEALNEHYYGLQDLKERLQRYFESLEFSEEQINEVQSRLFEINRLKRKYGRSLNEILEKGESFRLQLNQQEHRQEYLQELQKQVQTAYKQFEETALKLRQVRQQKALALQKEVEIHLHDLMLPHARFILQLKDAKPSAHGLDEADFMISMNPGEPVRSLAQVASGGELSRLMLGLKTIFTRLEGIQTVIFDEIDTGVSGQVATATGLKMSLLARDAQVFSVTHLAQVAACADQHYHVTKRQGQDFTETQIQCLSEDERIDQLALISQGELSDTARQAAQELYQRNQKKVKEARSA